MIRERSGLLAFAAISLFSVLLILHQSTILKHFQTTAELSYITTVELVENVNRERNNTLATTGAGDADVFLPGSLNLTRHESYSKCYVDPTLYEHHLNTPANNYGPKKYGLIYAPIPKAGSSNSRVKLEMLFGKEGTKQHKCFKNPSKSAKVFTFVREPTSRFVSCFQEMLKRWRTQRGPYDKIPEEYKNFWKQHWHIDFSKNHDGLLDALEHFLEIYDAYKLPNNHLQTQITRILRPKCIRVDKIFNLEDFDSVFGGFLSELGMNDIKNNDPHTHKLHLNMSSVSADAKQKICQMSAIDYCCLNFKLPPECEGTVSC